MIKNTFIFHLQGLNRRLRAISGMQAPGVTPPQTYQWRLPVGQGECIHPRPLLATCPAMGYSVTFSTSIVRRFWKKGESIASAHTLPTETIRELRLWLPSSSVQFGRYFNRGGEFPGAPSGNAPCQGTFVFISFCHQ